MGEIPPAGVGFSAVRTSRTTFDCSRLPWTTVVVLGAAVAGPLPAVTSGDGDLVRAALVLSPTGTFRLPDGNAASVDVEAGQLALLTGATPAQTLSAIGHETRSVALRVVPLLILLALADLIWQKRRLERSLRMTKEEVKQESRQTDIAPEVRRAIRRRQFMQARRRMLADVATADVVVVNPTHVAVALRYDVSKPAPEVVAKGADHVAAAIRSAAEEHAVPIVRDAPLARGLYRDVELGAQIPEQFFLAVAEILAFVYRTAARRPALLAAQG